MKPYQDIVDSGIVLHRVVDVDYLGGHKLHLWFSDGAEGNVDFAPLLADPVYSALSNERDFTAFGLEHGTLVWSKEIDIAPETLYDMATSAPAQ